MEKVNALILRQSLGKVLKRLEVGGKPILVEKDRKPAAVLISLDDYKRRFVDREADEVRREIVTRILRAKLRLPKDHDAVTTLRATRRQRSRD